MGAFPQVCLHQLTSSFPILSAQLHNRWSPVTYNLRRVLWECGLHRAEVLTVSINCKQAMVILWSLLLCTLTVYKPSTLPILYNGTLLASHQVTPMATPPMAHSLPHHYFRVTQKLYREQNPSCISRVLRQPRPDHYSGVSPVIPVPRACSPTYFHQPRLLVVKLHPRSCALWIALAPGEE